MGKRWQSSWSDLSLASFAKLVAPSIAAQARAGHRLWAFCTVGRADSPL